MSQANTPVPDHYLTFILGAEEYAVSIRSVQEIIGVLPTTPVPGSPFFVAGVVNLRGAIVPVVDLCKRFGMGPQARTEQSCIIVLRNATTVGIVADRVCDVVSISSDQIQHPQTFGTPAQAGYVVGIAAHAKGARIVLDAEAVSSGTAMSAAQPGM